MNPIKSHSEFKPMVVTDRTWCENVGKKHPEYVFTKEELDNAEKHPFRFIKELFGVMYYLNPPLFKTETT